MTDEIFENQLRARFAEEDKTLQDDAFIEATERRIRRTDLYRRIVLALAASAGGIIAGLQLPALFETMSGFGLVEEVGLTQLVDGLRDSSGLSGLSLIAVLGILGLSSIAAFSTDRV